MGKEPRVSIIILNWNGKDVLLECLSGIKALEYPNHRTIVIDNSSSDGSVEAVKNNYPEVYLSEQGSNFGVNIARQILKNTDYKSAFVGLCKSGKAYTLHKNPFFLSRVDGDFLKCVSGKSRNF